MAANTSTKVALRTGAAKDETLVSLDTGLTEDQGSANLNVLGNDPGSAKLYSLAQNPTPITTSTQFPIADNVQLSSGATISMNLDGTVHYNGSTWTAAFMASAQALAQGQEITDTFTYTIRMASGALSTASITVFIAGVVIVVIV